MVSVFSRSRQVSGTGRSARFTLYVYIGNLQTKPHTGWMLFENDAQTIFYSRRLELYWRKRPAWKHGHWEHLDVTHETAASARGLSQVFHIGVITKVSQGSSLTVPRRNSGIGSSVSSL